MVEPRADARLLDAVRRSDPGAFDLFVERYGQRLLAFGLRMCGQRQDAEDVLQETLLKAYEGLKALRDPKAVRTWLFQVAANQCRMSRRKLPPGRELSLDDLSPPEGPSAPLDALLSSATPPELEPERAALRLALEAALRELPPEVRIVVLLRDMEGLSTQETAAVLGLGAPAVKMRLHRGRSALRKRLEAFHSAGEAA